MPNYRTASFLLKPGAAARLVPIIDEYVATVRAAEPGTLLYMSLRDEHEPNRFVHIYAFADDAAEEAHHESSEAKEFAAAIGPEIDGPVRFGDYSLVASTQMEPAVRRG